MLRCVFGKSCKGRGKGMRWMWSIPKGRGHSDTGVHWCDEVSFRFISDYSRLLAYCPHSERLWWGLNLLLMSTAMTFQDDGHICGYRHSCWHSSSGRQPAAVLVHLLHQAVQWGRPEMRRVPGSECAGGTAGLWKKRESTIRRIGEERSTKVRSLTQVARCRKKTKKNSISAEFLCISGVGTRLTNRRIAFNLSGGNIVHQCLVRTTFFPYNKAQLNKFWKFRQLAAPQLPCLLKKNLS